MRHLALLIITLSTIACGAAEQFKGPDDGKIANAVPLELNAILDDRVGEDEQDTVDWKFFEMPYDDNFYCAVFWDNEKIKATMTIFSGSGTRMTGIDHTAALDYDKLLYHLKPGKYYLQIASKEGASVYTMKCGSGSMPPSLLGGGNTEPLPE